MDLIRGHPRDVALAVATWMPDTGPGMTKQEGADPKIGYSANVCNEGPDCQVRGGKSPGTQMQQSLFFVTPAAAHGSALRAARGRLRGEPGTQGRGCGPLFMPGASSGFPLARERRGGIGSSMVIRAASISVCPDFYPLTLRAKPAVLSAIGHRRFEKAWI